MSRPFYKIVSLWSGQEFDDLWAGEAALLALEMRLRGESFELLECRMGGAGGLVLSREIKLESLELAQ